MYMIVYTLQLAHKYSISFNSLLITRSILKLIFTENELIKLKEIIDPNSKQDKIKDLFSFNNFS